MSMEAFTIVECSLLWSSAVFWALPSLWPCPPAPFRKFTTKVRPEASIFSRTSRAWAAVYPLLMSLGTRSSPDSTPVTVS